MTDANNTVECRYIADRDEWQSWQIPSDKGNSRAQLRRMVEEWQAQKKILSDLAAIHPDINRALAIVLQSHELLSRATVTVAIAAQQPSEPAQMPTENDAIALSEFEFEESVEC
jgi:DNA-binding FrmR family transcriptional regulator